MSKEEKPSRGAQEKLEQERALRQAVKDGYPDRVAKILAAGVADVNARGREGNSPLHLAIKWGRDDIFDWLLQQDGINLGVKDKLGMTPLMCAAKWGRDHAVDGLLRQLSPEQINAQDDHGNTALIWAAAQDRLNIVKELVAAKGIALNIRAKDNMTALESAMDNHNPAIVRFLGNVREVEVARDKIKRLYDQRCVLGAGTRKVVSMKPVRLTVGEAPYRPAQPTTSAECVAVLTCG